MFIYIYLAAIVSLSLLLKGALRDSLLLKGALRDSFLKVATWQLKCKPSLNIMCNIAVEVL